MVMNESPEQFSPPLAGSVLKFRNLTFMPGPVPQVCEHADQVPHDAHLQCAGQGVSPQGAFSEASFLSHSLPPKSGCLIVRLRHLSPPPQVTEHPPHSLQPEYAQSLGHGFGGQFCFWVPKPTHSLPPTSGSIFPRRRDLVPLPQDWEQLPQVSHASHEQSSTTTGVISDW